VPVRLRLGVSSQAPSFVRSGRRFSAPLAVMSLCRRGTNHGADEAEQKKNKAFHLEWVYGAWRRRQMKTSLLTGGSDRAGYVERPRW
jgi:hypothetical protein